MAINAVTNKSLGTTLWVMFEEKFTSLVNNDVADFQALSAMVDPSGATSRQINYAVEPARAVSNAQFRNPGAANPAFINGESGQIVEKTATVKQMEVVAQFDYDVFNRAQKDPSAIYVGPMALEMGNQAITAKEALIIDYYGDGSGAVCTLGNISGAAVAGGQLTLPILNTSSAFGCIYWARENQNVVFYDAAGNAHDAAVASGTPAYYKVTGVDFATKKITVAAYDASGNLLTITAANTITTSDIAYNYSDKAEGGVFNRSAISDFGGLLHMPGLQSLGAADGRTVNGMVLSGQYKGTEVDAGGANLNPTHFGQLLTSLQRRLSGKYEHKTFKCSHEVYQYIIDQGEGQKWFTPEKNSNGGVSYMYYHQNESGSGTALKSNRWVPDFEIWAEPTLVDTQAIDGVTSKGPLMFKFTGFEFITLPGSSEMFRFQTDNGSLRKNIQAHLVTYGTFICTQSASIGRLKNFVIS
jgi:hypothetical protein